VFGVSGVVITLSMEVNQPLKSKSGSRTILPFRLYRTACATVFLMALTTHASAEDAALSAKVLQWASANLGKYQEAINFARHAPPPQPPVPPEVDPPCHVCGDDSKTQGETQVKAWADASENPEIKYSKILVSIDKDLTPLKALPGDTLSRTAEKALWPFIQDDIHEALGKLGTRLLDKADKMGRQYHREPKRAYAGIFFLIQASHDGMMLQAFQNGGGDNNADNQNLEWAREWTQSIMDEIDQKVVSGHQYNLCPVYAEIYRQVSLLGSSEPDVNRFLQTAQKLQDQLKFKISTKLDADVTEDDGSHFKATWESKAGLTLKLDINNSCYTPQFDNNGQMSVSVTSWDARSTKGPISLTSPHQFTATLGEPQLNLCDPHAVFQLPLGNVSGVPQEVITADGYSSKVAFFVPFMAAIVNAHEVNSGPTNELTGTSPSSQGAGSDSDSSGASSLDSLKAQIDAHRGDMNWIMSAEGKAVVAQMQQQAFNMAKGKMASAGVVAPNANNISQLTQSLSSAHLTWTNGQVRPVSQTLHVEKGSAKFTMSVTVQQQAQQ